MSTSMLVGYTGFVGSNIDSCHDFTWQINSKNKELSYGKNPDLLIYAGLRAEKFLANKDPEADYLLIKEAMEQIEKIAPKQLVLISTVDVYSNPDGVNEDDGIILENLAAYGKNRYLLEKWVREHYEDALIVRLPGLFGKNIKKNFIYDYIHVIPSMLKREKYEELSGYDSYIKESYQDCKNGFYKCCVSLEEKEKRKRLKEAFFKMGFSALNFTDSRSIFQFYPLSRLWQDIEKALDYKIPLLNIATEPVSAGKVYQALTNREFINELDREPAYYDMRTKYDSLFGGKKGYLMSKDEVLTKLGQFVKEECGSNEK